MRQKLKIPELLPRNVLYTNDLSERKFLYRFSVGRTRRGRKHLPLTTFKTVIMFSDIDLRALAELSGPERAFVSLYLSGQDAMQSLEQRVRKVRAMLSDNPVEVEHFDENMKLIRAYLEGKTMPTEGRCVFACWANDYLQCFNLEKSTRNLLWVDSSPYIRPLAELQDEYENYVVVAADNTATRVYLVTSAVAGQEARVKGDVKNSVKVGGWSQKRYARRREKELHNYAKEVGDVLADLSEREAFGRILLVGSRETLEEIKQVLPEPLAQRIAGEKGASLHEEDDVLTEAFSLFVEEERTEERNLWEQIKNEYMRGGRAVAGAEEVLSAAAVGRVDTMIVARDAKIPGIRCRTCENLSAAVPDRCPVCSSEDVFKEDLVNELVELMALSSAETEFVDPIPGLTEAGSVAALLRY
jgi:rubrerythrin